MSGSGQDETIDRRQIAYWCLYDWGNSAFPAIVLSFVFAPYFLTHIAGDEVSGTVLWSAAVTVSAVVIGLLSPIIGAFGDKGGRRRMWLLAFSAVAIVATAGMWTAAPGPERLLLALVLMAIANVGFEMAYVFYNALLAEIAPASIIGRVSGWGWGLGYFGSLVSMGLAYVLLISPDPSWLGLDRDMQEHIRITAPFAALWFLIFGLPLMVAGPADQPSRLGRKAILNQGLGELWTTIRNLPKTPSVAWFLLAHMVFIDGVNTLFVFGPLYAAGSFGFTASEVLLYGVTFYVAAGAGSLLLGWLDDLWGSKPMLLLSLTVMTGIVIAMIFVRDANLFWGLTLALAFFVGPVQAVSRSLMVRLAPRAQCAQLFGLYSLSGRATAPVGPALLSWIVAVTDTQRAGAVVIAVLLALGLLLMLKVREPRHGIGAE